MKILKEVRKQDDLYYQGAFWIKGNSVVDIKRGKFNIDGIQIPSDYEGHVTTSRSKNSLSHKNLWKEFNDGEENVPFNYYPRGRVAIYKGKAFIHINSLFNQTDIIDAIVDKYGIAKLDTEIECNGVIQGSHYDFLLD